MNPSGPGPISRRGVPAAAGPDRLAPLDALGLHQSSLRDRPRRTPLRLSSALACSPSLQHRSLPLRRTDHVHTPKRLLVLDRKWLLISVSGAVLHAVRGSMSFLSSTRSHSPNCARPFGTVDMQHMLAIELKGGKVEYTLDRDTSQPTRRNVSIPFSRTPVSALAGT